MTTSNFSFHVRNFRILSGIFFISLAKAYHWLIAVTLFLGGAAITLNATPVITSLSAPRQVIAPAQNLNLSVTATGTGPLKYQWSRTGKNLTGATASTLAITNASYADSGWYLVEVSDDSGTIRSKPVFVKVAPLVTQLRHWGNTFDGKALDPTHATDLIEVAVADNYDWPYTVGLKRDGTIASWGFQSTPAGLTEVVGVAAGAGSVLALKSDGTVIGWGGNSDQITLPSGLTDVVAISAGATNAIALKSDRTVVSWGSDAPQKIIPAGLNNVVAVAAGKYHQLALKADGTVVAWGGNYFGECNVPAGLSGVTRISAQSTTSLALKSDGSVVAWGNNYVGQATVPAGLSNVIDISANPDHSNILTAGGAVVGWGSNNLGQCSAPPGLDRVIHLAGGTAVSYVLRDATGDVKPVIISQPISQVGVETLGVTFSVSVTGNGPLTYQWRRNGTPISGEVAATLTLSNLILANAGSYDVVVTNHIGSSTSSAAVLTVNPVPTVTSFSAPRNVVVPGASFNVSVTATGTGQLHYLWTHNGRAVQGGNSSSLSIGSVTFQDSGYYLVFITDDYGTRRSAPIFLTVAPSLTQVRVWGLDYQNQVSSIPASMSDLIAVARGTNTTVGLHRDGTVSSWGEYGSLVPNGLTDVVSIAAGGRIFVALKKDGTVVTWGIFGFPAPAPLSNVVAIAAGGDFASALKSDGSIVLWGASFAQNVVPADLSAVIGIAMGGTKLSVLKSNGTVAGWDIYYGDANTRIVPFDLMDVKTLFPGNSIDFALTNEGTVFGWGNAYRGLVRIPPSLADITALSSGEGHVMALLKNGTVLAFGDNSFGQSAVPTDLANAFAIAAGVNLSLALCDNTHVGAPVINLSPSGKAVAAGGSAQFGVQAEGSGPLVFVWQIAAAGSNVWNNVNDGALYQGSRTPTLRVIGVSASLNGTSYRCVISNGSGIATSAVAALAVQPALVITNLSASRQVLEPGQNLFLQVSATGVGAIGFQWKHNGRDIPGATSATLQLTGLGGKDGGYYVAAVTDTNGSKRSAPFFVSVVPAATHVSAWGQNQPAILTNITDAIGVFNGYHNPVALNRKGQVVDLSSNPYTGVPVPSDLTDVASVAVGSGYTLALKGSGQVAAWGFGLEGNGSNIVPDTVSNIVSLSLSGDSTALNNEGKVVAWGSYGNGYATENLTAALTDLVAISGSPQYGHVLILKNDGTVLSWGLNTYGQARVPAGLNNVIGIATGGSHSLALKNDGTVVAWGYNDQGQSTVPAGLTDVVAIAAGGQYSLALRRNGSVVGWGSNYYGESTPPADLGGVIGISAGYWTPLALSSATANGITYGDVALPDRLVAGSNVSFDYTVTNSGTSGWGSSHRLVLSDRYGTTVGYASLGGILPGATRSVTFTFLTPFIAGTYQYHVRAQENESIWFGPDVTLSITVKPSGLKTDFNRDGQADVLWQNIGSGDHGLWIMNGTTPSAWISLPVIALDWRIVGTGDFNSDGQTDILWENVGSGDRGMWIMNGTVPAAWINLPSIALDWRIVGTGDFNGDGMTDILWENVGSGDRGIWIMNGTVPAAWINLPLIALNWRIAGTGDFNADGQTDVLWENVSSGDRGMWIMNGTVPAAWINLPSLTLDWRIAR